MARRRRNASKKPSRGTRAPSKADKRRRQMSAAYDLGCDAGWQSGADGSYSRAKAWVKRNGTRRQKDLLSGSTGAAKEFRRGLKSCVEGYHSIAGEFNPKRRKNRPARRRNGLALKRNRVRRRRNYPKGRAAEEAAYRAGVSRRTIAAVKRRKPSAWQDAPTTKSQMEKTSGGLHWDVMSAHNTPWRYQIRKLKGGYVVGFKAKRAGSVNKYINTTSSTARKPVYFRTQNDAFKAMVRHIMAGRHLPFKHPRRRR